MESRPNPDSTSEASKSPSFSPALKITTASTESPSSPPSISSNTGIDNSNSPSSSPTTENENNNGNNLTPTSILSISPTFKGTPNDTTDNNINSHIPSLSPSTASNNGDITSTPSSMPTPIPEWNKPPTTPSNNFTPTTLRPTMMLEHPTQPPHFQNEYEINARIALFVIATPMLIISGCFVWRWYHYRKFSQNYRDFEINAFSTADAEFT